MNLTDITTRIKIAWAVFTTSPAGRAQAQQTILNAEPDTPEFYAAMETLGYTSQTSHITDEEARAKFNYIMADKSLNDNQRYNLLYALDVAIQNNTDLGVASPTIQNILEAQGEIVMKDFRSNL